MTQPSKTQFQILNPLANDVLGDYSESLSKIMNEINKETDRGAALFSASILDEALKELLSEFLISGSVSKKLFQYPDPLSSFSARQNMCLVLGLISDIEYQECNTIRSIRNKFAHSSTYAMDFNSENIAVLCDKFRGREQTEKFVEKIGATDFNRINFIVTVGTLHWEWTKRIEFAKKNKRQPFRKNS